MCRLSEESHKDRILRVIDEMSLEPSEVELLEDCEMVTNLIIGQVLEMMGSEEMREDVLWLQAQHHAPHFGFVSAQSPAALHRCTDHRVGSG